VLWHKGKYKSKTVYLLHGSNAGYSIYKKEMGKDVACFIVLMKVQDFQIMRQDSK